MDAKTAQEIRITKSTIIQSKVKSGSGFTNLPQKNRELIAMHIAEFKKNGGHIDVIKPHPLSACKAQTGHHMGLVVSV